MRSSGRRGNRQVILEGDARKFVLAAARAGAVIVVVKTQVGDKWGIRSELKALLSGRNWLFSHSDSFFYIPLFFSPILSFSAPGTSRCRKNELGGLK